MVKEEFYKAMKGAGIMNSEGLTYHMYRIKKQKYGYSCYIGCPHGMSYEPFKSNTDILKDSLHWLIEYKQEKLEDMYVKIITVDFKKQDFKLVKTQDYEVYLGNDISGLPIIKNMNKKPHIMIAGNTGSGKSRLVLCIITNIICSTKALIYLVQIKKNDLSQFKSCAKGYARTVEEAIELFKMINEISDKREALFERSHCWNIEEYNAKHSKKLEYIYLFTDELSFFMPDKTNDKDTRHDKGAALDYIEQIEKAGRSSGIFVISCLQITTTDNVPSAIKKLSNIKISLNQPTKDASKNIVGVPDAYNLPQREAVISDGGTQFIYVPTIEKNMVDNFLKPFIKIDKACPSNEGKCTKYEVITDQEEIRKYREKIKVSKEKEEFVQWGNST